MVRSATPHSRCSNAIWFALLPLSAAVFAGCNLNKGSTAAIKTNGSHVTAVQTPDGQVYEAVFDCPEPSRANGWGVLMIGGGMGNDLDWTTPGAITTNGQDIQMTI